MLGISEENRSGVLGGLESIKRCYSVYSIKAESQRWARNSVDAGCQKASPWTSKLFICNFCPSSQAGRRGFDPRLPLHVFNNLNGFGILPENP
jgi:hypothetical protein